MSRRSGTPRDRATTRFGHAVTVTVITTVVAAAAKPHANDAVATKAADVATKAAAVAAHAVDATVDAVAVVAAKPRAIDTIAKLHAIDYNAITAAAVATTAAAVTAATAPTLHSNAATIAAAKPHVVAADVDATISGCTRDIDGGIMVRNTGVIALRYRRTWAAKTWGRVQLI